MTDPLEVYFLDVGQGDSSLICPPQSAPVLMDCCNAGVVEFALTELRCNEISAIVISHLDDDHIGGMLTFMSRFMNGGGRVAKVYAINDRHLLSESKNAASLINKCADWHEEQKFKFLPAHRTESPLLILKTTECQIELLSPSFAQVMKEEATYQKMNSNLVSAILRVECFGKSILLGADAPLAAWEKIEPILLRADVFRTPHHGALSNRGRNVGKSLKTMDDLYAAVSPGVSVFSVGTNNNYSHPRRDHVVAAGIGGCRRLCTQITKQCHPKPGDIRARAIANLKGDPILYYPDLHDTSGSEVPCAGTVMIEVSPDGTLETFPPRGGWHDQFITDHVPHALCRL